MGSRGEDLRFLKTWLERTERSATTGCALVEAHGAALAELWRRANPILGEVTLSAICERSLRLSAERFAPLSAARCGPEGPSLEALDPERAPRAELAGALAALTGELVSALSRLTDGILLPEIRLAFAPREPEGARPGPARRAQEGVMRQDYPRRLLPTGVRGLDEVLAGGLPAGSTCVVSGAPGTGKTILAQQVAFRNASEHAPALIFNTLSEAGAKLLSHLSRFSFFDAAKLGRGVHLVDLGEVLRKDGVAAASEYMLEQVSLVRPSLVVVDSFRVFTDLARGQETRRLVYEAGVHLMAWECASLIVGEYGLEELGRNPLLSMVDGHIALSQSVTTGEQRRHLRVFKLRGAAHNCDEHAFQIGGAGIEVFAPRVVIRRPARPTEAERRPTGISGLDALLGGGVPAGSGLLVGGSAGTGKSVLLLEFVYRGALAGERGVLFSFEESAEQLMAAGRSLGFDVDREVARGTLKVVFIPQPEIVADRDILRMREEIAELGARRVAVDSVSVFLHKLSDPRSCREKVFQLASLIHNADAVGLLSTDIPFGSGALSRFGVEETVLDGVLLLSAFEEGLERERYIEAYKLRCAEHLRGRHALSIEKGGLRIFPRHAVEPAVKAPPPAMERLRRLRSGVPGLDERLGGGLLERSVTLFSGSAGVGKSSFAFQFLLEGVRQGEKGVMVTLGEGPEQLLNDAESLGLPLREAVEHGTVEVAYLSPAEIRAGQFLAILGQRVQDLGARRLAFDSISGVVAAGLKRVPLGDLLYAFAFRFKSLGVTSLVSVEAHSLYTPEPITESDFSPVADNILLARYHPRDGRMVPTLRVLKSRGSPHDLRLFELSVGAGGLRLGPAIDGGAAPPRAHKARDHRPARR